MKSGRPNLSSLLLRKIITQSFSRLDLLIMFHQVIIEATANFSCNASTGSIHLHRFFTGTIIDNKVCHPRNNDFYLCAHAGMIVSSLFCFVKCLKQYLLYFYLSSFHSQKSRCCNDCLIFLTVSFMLHCFQIQSFLF